MGADQRLSRRDPSNRANGAPCRARSLVHQQLEPAARSEDHPVDDCGGDAIESCVLGRLMLNKGDLVQGLKRLSSSFNTALIDHLYKDRHADDVRFVLHYSDLTDATNMIRILQETQPDVVYNLAAQSHVKVSFESPE